VNVSTTKPRARGLPRGSGRSRYRKAVVSIIALSVLSLLIVNAVAFCIPLFLGLQGGTAPDALRSSHVAMAWIQIIPLSFWLGVILATWVATVVTMARGSRGTVVLSWLLRVIALVHLTALAVVFVLRVMQPDAPHALSRTLSSLSYSGFWVVCTLVVASVYLSRRMPVHASSSLLLVLYSITSIAWIRPALASSLDGLGGPFGLALQVAVPILASMGLDSLFAIALAWLAYRTIPLIGAAGADVVSSTHADVPCCATPVPPPDSHRCPSDTAARRHPRRRG